MSKHRNKYGNWMLGLLGLMMSVSIISCSKDKTVNQISYTSNSNSTSTWQSDDTKAAVMNDSLMIVGTKNSKSSITIIVAGSQTGDYPLSIDQMKSFIIIDKDGSNTTNSKLFSVDGIVSITENDTKKKEIKGTFTVNMVNGVNLLVKENISGEFTSKYSK